MPAKAVRFVIPFLWGLTAAFCAAPGSEATVGIDDRSTWPKTVAVQAGDVRTRIESSKLWTLSGLSFGETVLATEESAYGTVLTIRNVGHLGTAHFLDIPGKPGEVEKENVTALKLFVDDRPVDSFRPTMKLDGRSFRMERRSKIRAFDLTSTASIQDNVLSETVRIRSSEKVDLQSTYPFMYAWTHEMTAYVFGDDSGIVKRGAFRKEGKYQAETIKNACWVAMYDGSTGKGGVCCYLQSPADAETWFLLIDAPEIYRKTAAYSLVDKIVPAGFEGTYQSAVGFFTATEAEWENAAMRRAKELKSMKSLRPSDGVGK